MIYANGAMTNSVQDRSEFHIERAHLNRNKNWLGHNAMSPESYKDIIGPWIRIKWIRINSAWALNFSCFRKDLLALRLSLLFQYRLSISLVHIGWCCVSEFAKRLFKIIVLQHQYWLSLYRNLVVYFLHLTSSKGLIKFHK